jgi:hypothetical protein
MAETPTHKRAKNRAAGQSGQTEVPLSRGRRLDALSAGGTATEVERSETTKGLDKAVRRLAAAPAKRHVLQVPQPNMPAAVDAMRRGKLHGTVKNLSGTKRRAV